MKKFTLILTITIASLYANAQLIYTFDSVKTTSGMTDPTPVPIAGPGLTCGSFSATGTSLNSSAAARFDFAAWPVGSTGGPGDTVYALMTGAINTAEYYEVTLTPAAGYTITGDSIKFGFERSTTGVRNYAVRSSVDGYTTNLTAVYGAPTTNVNVQPGNIFFLKKDIATPQSRNIIVLGGAAFTNLSTPVTFRFYGWNSEPGTAGTFSIDNVSFIGSSAIATGITEKPNNAINIYPNPSSTGIFTLDGLSSNKTIITVYDIVGKIVSSREVDSSSKQSVDLSNQANGSYFVQIKNDAGVTTKKIILNK